MLIENVTSLLSNVEVFTTTHLLVQQTIRTCLLRIGQMFAMSVGIGDKK